MKRAQAFALAASKPVSEEQVAELRALIALYLLPSITRRQMPELVDDVAKLFLICVRTGRYMERL